MMNNIEGFYRNKYGIPGDLAPHFVDLPQEGKTAQAEMPKESVDLTAAHQGKDKKTKKSRSRKGTGEAEKAQKSAEKPVTGESKESAAPQPQSEIKKNPDEPVYDFPLGVGSTITLPGGYMPGFPSGNISGTGLSFADIGLEPLSPDVSLLDQTKIFQSGVNDQYLIRDGLDESRDIVGVTSTEGKASEPYRFTVELKNLQPDAENGNLDMYLLISVGQKGKVELPDGIQGKTSKPWDLAIGAYDNKHFSVYDENGQIDPKILKELKFNPEGNTVEFGVDKSALRDKGWKDGEPVTLQPFTAKDFVKQSTDSLDTPAQKPWANNGNLTAFIDTATGIDSIAAPPPQTPPPAASTAEAQPIDKWKNDIIYFVLTDRFSDGDKTNNMDVVPTDMKKYHGGDLQGLIDKLDYIKDIGASSIWLTPPMKNQTHFFETDSYHGYWPIDFYDTDPHVGDMKKFEELVTTAHEKGLKIILDIPLNHTAWEHPLYKDPEKKDWFHHIGDVKDWEDPYWAENGSIFGLPDLAQENPQVEKYLIDTAKFWVDKGIDGFRLDAVKNVPLNFWAKFDRAIHDYAGKDFMLVGEYFDGNPAKVAKYQKEDMSSLFDYPLYWTLKDTFANDGSMRNLAGKLADCDKNYPNPGVMSVFLDNHDTPRFLTEARGDKNKLKLALAFAMTINRMPTIYYGTETAMEGNCDIMGAVENRKDMQWDNDPKMLEYFKNLTSIRNNHEALREGKMLEMWQDDKIFAYARQTPNEEAIVVLNNGYDQQDRDITLRAESQIKNGTVMKDLLTGDKVTVQNGKIHVSAQGKGARIFVKA